MAALSLLGMTHVLNVVHQMVIQSTLMAILFVLYVMPGDQVMISQPPFTHITTE
jgi:hypothetical protein